MMQEKKGIGKIGYNLMSLLSAIVVLLFSLSARAQEYPSLLWEITGNGLERPSYLYGTIHSFDSKAFRNVSHLAPKIAASDVFAMEMILDLDNENIMDLFHYALMPGDTTISMLLDSAQYARLERYVTDSAGMPMMLLARVKPFFIMAMMMETGGTQDAARFLDDSLAQIAKLANKKVIGIETMKEQLAAVDMIPLQEQARMLIDEVDSAMASSSGNEMSELVALYATSSLDSLYALYNQKELSNTFQRALVTDRNHRMASRIAESLGKNVRMFVAVGALHLPGEEGVISLLRKQGFSVTPIKLN